jgi:DegV family protein with EDD domain
MRECIHTFFTVTNTRYLQASGRLGRLQGALVTVLDIKPLVTVADGKLTMVGKVRSRRRSLEQLVTMTREALFGSTRPEIAVIHAGAREDAENLKDQIERELSRRVQFLLESPTILSAHGGPGLIGVVSCDMPVS